MSISRRQLRIYVSPDQGSIADVVLDLDAVELALNKVPAAQASDEVAIRELSKQIRAAFKNIVPDDIRGRKQLALILRGWVNIQGFNGIVLRLTGSIEHNLPAKQEPQELTRLTNALEKERYTREASEIRSHSLEAESRRFKALYERTSNDLIEQRKLLKQFQEIAEHERRAAKRMNDNADMAAQELGRSKLEVERYKLEVEQLQNEIKSRPDHAQSDKELALLRTQKRNLEIAEQQLLDTLNSRDQEIADLNEQIRLLTEGEPIEDGTVESDNLYIL